MGGINIVSYTVTATGTVTTNDTRISGLLLLTKVQQIIKVLCFIILIQMDR